MSHDQRGDNRVSIAEVAAHLQVTKLTPVANFARP